MVAASRSGPYSAVVRAAGGATFSILLVDLGPPSSDYDGRANAAVRTKIECIGDSRAAGIESNSELIGVAVYSQSQRTRSLVVNLVPFIGLVRLNWRPLDFISRGNLPWLLLQNFPSRMPAIAYDLSDYASLSTSHTAVLFSSRY